jgi:glycosyltransferase involved in cell wall biosynthesis
VVRDGTDGFIVPVRDVGRMTEGLTMLAEDGALLGRMTASAMERAAEFTTARYSDRLIKALEPWIR